jgi:hypothetical protein
MLAGTQAELLAIRDFRHRQHRTTCRWTGGAIMGRSWIGAVLVISSLCGLFAARAFAHPASGIVVDTKGQVFFIHTGRGVCKIDARGRLTYIHKVSGGGHFLALDTEGKFPADAYPQLFQRITPSGVKPAILFASGGAPFVVNHDGNLYYTGAVIPVARTRRPPA